MNKTLKELIKNGKPINLKDRTSFAFHEGEGLGKTHEIEKPDFIKVDQLLDLGEKNSLQRFYLKIKDDITVVHNKDGITDISTGRVDHDKLLIPANAENYQARHGDVAFLQLPNKRGEFIVTTQRSKSSGVIRRVAD